MLSSIGNAGSTYSHNAWQSKRHAPVAETVTGSTMREYTHMATKNGTATEITTREDGTPLFTKGDFSEWAYTTFSEVNGGGGPSALTSYLNDERNYIERKNNKQEIVRARRNLVLQATMPDPQWLRAVEVAAGDKGRIDTGDVSNVVRRAVWLLLDDPTFEEYLADHTSGDGKVTRKSPKVSALEAENAALRDAVAANATMMETLQAQLAQLMAQQGSTAS